MLFSDRSYPCLCGRTHSLIFFFFFFYERTFLGRFVPCLPCNLANIKYGRYIKAECCRQGIKILAERRRHFVFIFLQLLSGIFLIPDVLFLRISEHQVKSMHRYFRSFSCLLSWQSPVVFYCSCRPEAMCCTKPLFPRACMHRLELCTGFRRGSPNDPGKPIEALTLRHWSIVPKLSLENIWKTLGQNLPNCFADV